MNESECPMDDADFKVLYLWLEKLVWDIRKVNAQLSYVNQSGQYAEGFQNRHDLLMKKFEQKLQDIKTDSQRLYVLRHLPFAGEPNYLASPMHKHKQKGRQLGWHRSLSNIWEQPESFQAVYGWLEYQYLECEKLKQQIETAGAQEKSLLEERLAVIEADYLELTNKIITNGARHRFPLIGGGRLF